LRHQRTLFSRMRTVLAHSMSAKISPPPNFRRFRDAQVSAHAHTQVPPRRARFDSMYAPWRAFVPQNVSLTRPPCHVRLQAPRFQKQRHAIGRALTPRTR
jgi:hypothetical protein